MSRFVSYSTGRDAGWGHLKGDVITDLTAHFPSLRAAIEAGALIELAKAAGPKLSLDQVSLTIPVTNPEKIICVGVNYPDRNAEYKDGQDAPPNMSLFIRFPRSFTGPGQPLIRPPESHQLDYEGEVKASNHDYHAVRAVVEWKAPIGKREDIEVFVRPGRIGRTSLTFTFEIHPAGKEDLRTTGEVVWVYTNQETHQSAPLPESLLGLIEAYEGGKA